MKIFKNKFSFFLFALFFILGILMPLFFQAKKIEINFFYSKTCPHCARENLYLDKLEKEHPEIEIKRYEISERKNIELLKRFYKNYSVLSSERGLVPATFIDDAYFIGFSKEIKEKIENRLSRKTISEKDGFKLPSLSEIDIKKYSLSGLAVVLGFLDGFNVCSLGVLVLILGLVLFFKSRKKILIFGGLFILTTAFVYGALIILWYRLFSLLVPYTAFMKLLIAFLAILGGIYFLKQFIKFRKYGPNCDASSGIVSKFSLKFQQFFQKTGNIFLLITVVFLFTAIVTIVEFPCSAAVPLVFAGILAQSHLSVFSYFLYLFLFLIFYLLDEIIIFLVAFLTMKIWLTSNKVIVWAVLFEAIILFILGFWYLFGFSLLL